MSRKDIRSWLTKQTLWQVHIPVPKKIHHPRYDVTKPNEEHQSDLLYMPHNVFEENTYIYILKGTDVASRYTVARPLRTKKSSKVAFVLESLYKNGGVFKYPKTFQCDNGSEFKNEVTKLHEKHNFDIQRATTKYKHTHTALWKPLTKSLSLLFKSMDLKSLNTLKSIHNLVQKFE